MREFIDIVEARDLSPLVRVLNKHLDDVSLAPEQWLVHFSSDAPDICANGFTRGVPLRHGDWTSASGRDYQGSGYNFAAAATDENALMFWAENAPAAVVFRAEGVRSYHYDGFYQIVFRGSEAKRPMYLIEWADDGPHSNVYEDATFAITAKDGQPLKTKLRGSLDEVLYYIEKGRV